MNLKEKLAALYAEADELQKKGDALTDDDVTRVAALGTEIADTEAKIKKQDDATAALARFKTATAPATTTVPGGVVMVEGANLGERFIKSAGFQAFRAAEHGQVDGRPINIKAEGLGYLGQVSKADPAPLSTSIAGGPSTLPARLPDVRDLTYRYPSRFLDLISHGTTTTPYVQYRALTAINAAAAVVPEGTVKPLSTLTMSLTTAAAYTFADGFKVTNQELADDGIMASLLNTTLQQNLAFYIESIIINGTGSGQPSGILNTTGVLQQAYTVDAVTTIRNAINLLQVTSFANIEAIVLNPADWLAISIVKDSQGRYLGNGPFGDANGILWQTPVVLSTRVAAGTAILGQFSSIQLLDLEPLSVLAFNQNEDDARKNLTYIRAEQRSLLLNREPAKIAVATLHA